LDSIGFGCLKDESLICNEKVNYLLMLMVMILMRLVMVMMIIMIAMLMIAMMMIAMMMMMIRRMVVEWGGGGDINDNDGKGNIPEASKGNQVLLFVHAEMKHKQFLFVASIWHEVKFKKRKVKKYISYTFPI
jgi:hypothetical protein